MGRTNRQRRATEQRHRAHKQRGQTAATPTSNADDEVFGAPAATLLLGATRAVTVAGPQTSRYGTSRTRSYRHSFLIVYAGRIRERLTISASDAETAYSADHGGALVPVLTARRERVDHLTATLFPDLVEHRLPVSNAAGWGAGRAAAVLARLDVRESIAPRAG